MAVLGTRVTATTTATLLAEATTTRVPALIRVPAGGSTVYYGGPGVTSGAGFEVQGGSQVEIDLEVGEAIYGIVASGTQVVHILEQIPASTMGWGFVIDPTSEDAANTELNINDGAIYRAFSPLGLDPPEPDMDYASSVDTEGEIPVSARYSNRTITIGMRVYGSSAAQLAQRISDLQQKVAKVNAEQGTLKITSPSGAVRIFDLVSAHAPGLIDSSYGINNRAEVDLELEARPFSRGAEVSGIDKAETTLPYVSQIDSGPAGEVPALGRLAIDEDDADSQAWVIWGLESRHFDEGDPSTKKLFYEAEDLFATGGSAAATGPAGASGSAGNKVVTSAGLISYYTQVVSMKASTVAGAANGSGSYPAHVGTYQAFTRIQVPTANTGDFSIRLEWGEGDFGRFTENTPYEMEADSPLEGQWVLVDLGQVNLTKVEQGTQQWDGRIACASTVDGDTVHIDYVMLVPVAEGSGQAFAVTRAASSSVGVTARDAFDTHTLSVSLIGTTPPVAPGGTWTEAGDTDDYLVSLESILGTNQVAQRTAVSDSATTNGCFARCGNGSATNVIVSATVATDTTPTTTTGERWVGVFARYTDTSNWLFGGMKLAKGGAGQRYARPILYKRVAGTLTLMAQGEKIPTVSVPSLSVSLSADTSGRVVLSFDPFNLITLTAQHADLATGGTLETGGYGIYDVNTTSQARTRRFDSFVVQATALTTDYPLAASQTIEIRDDSVQKESVAGGVWQPPGKYEGDLLTVPCAGSEGRSVRWIVKTSRGIPGIEPDSAIDNLSARLHWKPRYFGLGE